MRFPTAGSAAPKTLALPALDGGLNVSDAAQRIEDNQLSECVNFYYRRGALRTRPGLRVAEKTAPPAGDTVLVCETADGAYTVLYTANPSWNEGRFFRYDHREGTLARVDCGGETPPVLTTGLFTGDMQGGVLFLGGGEMWRIAPGDLTARKLEEGAFYTPCVMVNARPLAGNGGLSPYAEYEGFNRLTARFESRWTTDGEGVYYLFPVRLDTGAGDTVMRYTHADGAEYTFTIDKGERISQPVTLPELGEVRVRATETGFVFVGADDRTVALPDVGFSGNLQIFTWRRWDEEDKQSRRTLLAGTAAAFYGGDSHGTLGGNRLFLSGSDLAPNLVWFSDANEPLYFPENNFFYVGAADERVTAMGKQQSYLILFKERTVWAAYYQSATVDADALAAATNTDAAATAYFPLLQISDVIGCDCPRTVKMCGNRLVWANRERRVYMLSSLTAFSARSVRHISHAVEPLLKERDFSGADAGVFDNAYHLLLDGDMFLFDFSDYGFSYNNNYVSEERAAKRIAWYRWNVELVNGDQVLFPCTMTDSAVFYKSSAAIFRAVWQEGASDHAVEAAGYEDGCWTIKTAERALEGAFATKRFALGAMGRWKHVTESVLLLAQRGGTANLSTVTEKGRWYWPYPVDCPPPQETAEDFFACRVTPNEYRVRTFGLALKTTGEMAVGDVSISYIPLGGVR